MRQSEVTGLDPANDNPSPPSGQGELFGVRDVDVGQVAIGEPLPHLRWHVDGMDVIHEIARRGGDVPE